MSHIEYMFSNEFLKTLKLKEEDAMHYIASSVLPTEEYALNIGYLKAIKEIRQDYNLLAKNYFGAQNN